ncbi:MAG: DUF1272 domain-containing protein [Gammaproteobacteria bacterium]
MLELRPSCEHCQRALPPAARDAMICTYECTFCADCVETVLHNVCPNCGGGFTPRPIRPARHGIRGNGLPADPASTKPVHKAIDPQAQATLISALANIPPHER